MARLHPVSRAAVPKTAENMEQAALLGPARCERRDSGDVVFLTLSGYVDADALILLREAAFAAIGAAPRVLCLDLQQTDPTEIATINNLVTIARVAALMRVELRVRASQNVLTMLRETGLARILPPDSD